MKLSRLFFTILIVLPVTRFATAQERPDWIPPAVEALRGSASKKTEFALSHSMLVFASRLNSQNEDLRRVIAGVSGVSVHNYRFTMPGMYDPDALNSVQRDCQAAGWTRLMNSHPKDGGPGMTEVWIRMDNNAVSNVAILAARSSEVNFILVSGSISPLDLFRLSGHFGIPRIEGGVLVPNPQRP